MMNIYFVKKTIFKSRKFSTNIKYKILYIAFTITKISSWITETLCITNYLHTEYYTYIIYIYIYLYIYIIQYIYYVVFMYIFI